MLYKETKFAVLPQAQQRELIAKAQRGDIVARDRMVEANMRLVFDYVKRYSGRIRDLEDLVQEGAAGLVKAIERFDLSSGYRFSTYATPWIRQAVTRALSHYTYAAIDLPAYAWDELVKVRHAIEDTEQVDVQNVAASTGIFPDHVEALAYWLRTATRSLDEPIDSDNDGALVEVIADGDDTFIRAEDTDVVEQLLQVLNGTDRRIIEMHYGLGKYRYEYLCDSYEAIGRNLGYTRERIRQRHRDAIKCMQEEATWRREAHTAYRRYMMKLEQQGRLDEALSDIENTITHMMLSDLAPWSEQLSREMVRAWIAEQLPLEQERVAA